MTSLLALLLPLLLLHHSWDFALLPSLDTSLLAAAVAADVAEDGWKEKVRLRDGEVRVGDVACHHTLAVVRRAFLHLEEEGEEGRERGPRCRRSRPFGEEDQTEGGRAGSHGKAWREEGGEVVHECTQACWGGEGRRGKGAVAGLGGHAFARKKVGRRPSSLPVGGYSMLPPLLPLFLPPRARSVAPHPFDLVAAAVAAARTLLLLLHLLPALPGGTPCKALPLRATSGWRVDQSLPPSLLAWQEA